MWVAFTSMQSAGRSGALDTGRHASGDPGDRRGCERKAEAKFESALEEMEEVGGPSARRTECFLLSLFHFLWRTGGRGLGRPTRIKHFDLGLDITMVGRKCLNLCLRHKKSAISIEQIVSLPHNCEDTFPHTGL